MKYPYIVTLHYNLNAPMIRATIGPFKTEKKALRWIRRNCDENQIWQTGAMITAKQYMKRR